MRVIWNKLGQAQDRAPARWMPVCCALLLSLLWLGCQRVEESDRLSTTDSFAVEITISPETPVTVGDRVDVRILAQHPEHYRAIMPTIRDDERISLRSRTSERRDVGDGYVISMNRYNISLFEIGTYTVITGDVRFVARDEDEVTRPLPERTVEVRSLLDEEDVVVPAEPDELLSWPRRVPLWLWVIPLIALLALLLGLVMARWLRRRRTFIQQPPPRPPHEIALNALALLKTKGYIERGEIDPFYIELSAIVRSYLEGRFGLRAPELTTEEFIREATSTQSLNSDQQKLVAGFLEQSDLVKFARFRPDAVSMQDAWNAAERLVQETRERVQAPTASKTEGAS